MEEESKGHLSQLMHNQQVVRLRQLHGQILDQMCQLDSIFGQELSQHIQTTQHQKPTTPTLMGKEGTPGLGIKSKSISYAIGTSGNTPPTSGWQESIPNVSANQYLWTKTTLVYTDDSKTESYSVGKMGANGADAKLLYLTASAENMVFNADDTPKTTQTINITAKLQNVTGTATFAAIPYIGNTAQAAITLGGSGNTRTLTSAQMDEQKLDLNCHHCHFR